jgi:hypothetical protein
MQSTHLLKSLPDDELLGRLASLASQARRLESALVAHIAEVDSRRLYAREACPSMFAYCVERLGLSEAEAYLRITAARASREHPLLLDMLADGRLHLSGIARLASHLTLDNRDAVLARAACSSKRGIEELIAELSPRSDVPALIRRLPTLVPERVAARGQLVPERVAAGRQLVPGRAAAAASAGGVVSTPAPIAAAAVIEPIAPSRYKVQFTASATLRDKLERLRALMRPTVPDGDLAAVIEEAVTEKLLRLEARRFGQTKAPRRAPTENAAMPGSRHIPAAIRRIVRQRDGDRCRYVDPLGRRCTGRERLEFHHRHPFGHGGEHEAENISLLCRTHNAYLARIDYGETNGREAPRGMPASG